MFTVISWDWRGQPDLEEINRAVQAVFDPRSGTAPSLGLAPAGGDSYELVVSSRPLDEAERAAAVALWYETDPQPKGPLSEELLFPAEEPAEEELSLPIKVAYWYCGRGHRFAFGQEDWHREVTQGQDEDGALIPMYCTEDDEDGEPCLDSSSLYRD